MRRRAAPNIHHINHSNEAVATDVRLDSGAPWCVKKAQKGRRQPHPFMNWNAAVRLVARLGLTWTAVFLLGGGTAAGKAWFTTVAATAFANPKAGVPLVVLAWLLLFSATLAAAVWRRPDEHDVVHRLPPSCLSLLPLPLLLLLLG